MRILSWLKRLLFSNSNEESDDYIDWDYAEYLDESCPDTSADSEPIEPLFRD